MRSLAPLERRHGEKMKRRWRLHLWGSGKAPDRLKLDHEGWASLGRADGLEGEGTV